MCCSILTYKFACSIFLLFVLSVNCEIRPLWSYMGIPIPVSEARTQSIQSKGRKIETPCFYILGPEIGHGQVGTIYLAWDEIEKCVVAVKLAKLQWTDFSKAVKFMKEAETFDGVATMIDTVVYNGFQGIVMELLGTSLLIHFNPDKNFDDSATGSAASSYPPTPRDGAVSPYESTQATPRGGTFSPYGSTQGTPRGGTFSPYASMTSTPRRFGNPSSPTSPRSPSSPPSTTPRDNTSLFSRPSSPSGQSTVDGVYPQDVTSSLPPASVQNSPSSSFIGDKPKPFPVKIVRNIGDQVITILDYMHNILKTAHGDLFIQNIITGNPNKGEDGKLKVLDFDKIEEGKDDIKVFDLAMLGAILMTLLGQQCDEDKTADIILFMENKISSMPEDSQDIMRQYLAVLQRADKAKRTTKGDYVELLKIFEETRDPLECFWKTNHCARVGDKRFDNVRIINSGESKQIQINISSEDFNQGVPNASAGFYIHNVQMAGKFDDVPEFKANDTFNWFEIKNPVFVSNTSKSVIFKFDTVSVPEDTYVQSEAIHSISDGYTTNAAKLWFGDDGRPEIIQIQSSTALIEAAVGSIVAASIHYTINGTPFRNLDECTRKNDTTNVDIILGFNNDKFT